jgi:L-aminopeptidase/D-esterase-like protein
MKSGLGSAAVALSEELTVGALVAVNAFGDVIDPDSGEILAGARTPETNELADTLAVMRGGTGSEVFGSGSRTVIGVVATNAVLTKEEVNKVAQMAQDGIARTVRPAHTMVDGDTLFALATGEVEADVNLVGAYGVEVVAEAVVRAVRQAEGAGGLPAWDELRSGVE